MNEKTIPFGKPILGDEERQAVLDTLDGPILAHGPRGKAFEKVFADFTSAPYALSVSSCTAGLHLGYFYLGLGAGDEVIVPAQTHTATAHAVEYTGATPVFVDAEAITGNIDLDQVEEAITERTRAISIVHFLGKPVNMGRLMEIANKHGLFVVEDCALSVGAAFRGVHTGLHGDMGAFSFYPVKHMTTAEGGMVITRRDDMAAKMERQKAFGVNRTVSERPIPGVYDVTMLGYNYRMNEIEAAIGIVQVSRLKGFLDQRRKNYTVLYDALRQMDEVTPLDSGDDTGMVAAHYCLCAVLSPSLAKRRYEVIKHLKNQGVGTSVYYPRPVPHMSYYSEKYGFGKETFPQAARISYQSIALPVGPHLDEDDMIYIVNTLKMALR
ncbi:MAG TPA: DegT/DnrJ/EryC1/StrS aminotransferase family protein [Nitrospirae bacterium]|nr:DegT/DnrJ/EryC1/StrS aminotransferase family protein [Nitrospirota bacterium]